MAAPSRRRVAVTCHQMQVELPRHLDALAAAGYDVIAPPLLGQQFSEDALIELLDGADGIIAGDDPLSERVLASSPTLRVVVRWGIGMDSVDHDAAARLGITVRNTPGVFGDEVADSALAYVLLLARGHHRVDRLVRDGEWPKVEGVSLSGERLGVVGLGSIGRAIVARGRGFGMDVVGSDPLVQGDPGCDVVSLDELLSTSRFVVLAAPLTAETHHLINSDTLARMRADAFLVNVGRGPLVDEAALISTLQQGQIAGAGLDVFEVEPLPLDSPLRHLDGVILGAHNGSNTRQGVARASDRAVEILREELERA
jgi:D-3-phosphoglycerate dehydrogenase